MGRQWRQRWLQGMQLRPHRHPRTQWGPSSYVEGAARDVVAVRDGLAAWAGETSRPGSSAPTELHGVPAGTSTAAPFAPRQTFVPCAVAWVVACAWWEWCAGGGGVACGGGLTTGAGGAAICAVTVSPDEPENPLKHIEPRPPTPPSRSSAASAPPEACFRLRR